MKKWMATECPYEADIQIAFHSKTDDIVMSTNSLIHLSSFVKTIWKPLGRGGYLEYDIPRPIQPLDLSRASLTTLGLICRSDYTSNMKQIDLTGILQSLDGGRSSLMIVWYFVWSVLFGIDRKVHVDIGELTSKATKADINEIEMLSGMCLKRDGESYIYDDTYENAFGYSHVFNHVYGDTYDQIYGDAFDDRAHEDIDDDEDGRIRPRIVLNPYVTRAYTSPFYELVEYIFMKQVPGMNHEHALLFDHTVASQQQYQDQGAEDKNIVLVKDALVAMSCPFNTTPDQVCRHFEECQEHELVETAKAASIIEGFDQHECLTTHQKNAPTLAKSPVEKFLGQLIIDRGSIFKKYSNQGRLPASVEVEDKVLQILIIICQLIIRPPFGNESPSESDCLHVWLSVFLVIADKLSIHTGEKVLESSKIVRQLQSAEFGAANESGRKESHTALGVTDSSVLKADIADFVGLIYQVKILKEIAVAGETSHTTVSLPTTRATLMAFLADADVDRHKKKEYSDVDKVTVSVSRGIEESKETRPSESAGVEDKAVTGASDSYRRDAFPHQALSSPQKRKAGRLMLDLKSQHSRYLILNNSKGEALALNGIWYVGNAALDSSDAMQIHRDMRGEYKPPEYPEIADLTAQLKRFLAMGQRKRLPLK
ncbi:hypothetical protein BGZ83_003844 [Gryganskiella cystojenkinii]|nr:hypothetical protein BGZ83_003844 [Gryganskiella cystojenkinii]